MRFSQGLIYALTNPQMGRNLFNVGRETGQTLAGQPRQIKEITEQKRNAIQTAATMGQEATAAAQQGDTAALGSKINALRDAASKTSSSQAQATINAQIEKLQAMMPAAQKIGSSKAVAAIPKIDMGLEEIESQIQKTAEGPEKDKLLTAKVALQNRRQQLMSDPEIAAGYGSYVAEKNTQTADAYLKKRAVAKAQREEETQKAYGFLAAGVPADRLATVVSPESMAEAKGKFARLQESIAAGEKAIESNTPLTDAMISDLPPEYQTELKKKIAAGMSTSSINKRYATILKEIADSKNKTRTEALEDADAQTVATKVKAFLNSKSKTGLSFSKDIQEYWGELDAEEERPAFEKEVTALFATGFNSAIAGGNSDEAAEQYAIDYATAELGKRYPQLSTAATPEQPTPRDLLESNNTGGSAMDALTQWLEGQR